MTIADKIHCHVHQEHSSSRFPSAMKSMTVNSAWYSDICFYRLWEVVVRDTAVVRAIGISRATPFI